MTVHNKTTRAILCVAAALAWAGTGQAQANPEAGDVAPVAGGQAQFGASAGGTVAAPAPSPSGYETTTAPEAEAPVDPGADDHSAVVGTWGVGFFGVMDLPVGGCDNNACTGFNAEQALPAPAIGIRYWLNDTFGIEGALGLHFSTTSSGPVTQSQFGFALHGAVPIALAHAGHFTFEVVPQLNFGIASGSIETTVAMMSTSTDTSGLLFEIGGKIGGEIHFGFIDLPQLSLQAAVGLMIRHEGRGAEVPAGGGMTTKIDVDTTSISTGVDEAPWKLFTGNISAIYYFGG